jgi:alkylation response protein AidB-like acyl-CoA dehydrogenase
MHIETSTQDAPEAAESPDREGFLAGLCGGRFHWDLVHPFPKQDTDDRRAGDAVLSELRRFLSTHVDPDAIEDSGALPDWLLDELRSRRYLALRMDPELGGLGLSVPNAFRVIEAAMSWAVPVGWCLAIQNGLGAGAYLPLLPDGPLRDLIARRVAEGAVFGDADTEPAGASNERRTTTATITADGSVYVIDGEKICIGNGPVADFLVVSATVDDAEGERVEYFFLETSTAGFSVRSAQEFIGLKGARIGALSFDSVRVPREQMLTLPEDVDTEFEVNRPARMYIVSAPALAIAKLCAHWSREFVNRRAIDGLPLGSYDAIQNIVAATLADVFAIESIAEWCLLAESREDPDDFRLEQSAAKNLTSVACWRVVDRTVSLLAAEGLETARSKAARGAQPLPVERALRDARALRVAGGVDFLLDKYFGETVVLSRVRDASDPARIDGAPGAPAVLSARNREHLRFIDAEIAAFPAACRRVLRDGPLPDRIPIHMNRIANELLTMAVTLSRAATLAAEGQGEVQALADVYCAAARHRLARWWRQAADADEPDYGTVARNWLADGRPRSVLADVLAQPPTADLMEDPDDAP